MVQCEMCGSETARATTVKVEGAELDVCTDCSDYGTEVQQKDAGSTSTKYSTSGSTGGASGGSGSGSGAGRSGGTGSGGTGSGSGSATGSTGSAGGGASGSSGGRRDMFDDVDEVAQDYDQRIRQAREQAGLSQESLADQLNEKASLIRKLEHGNVLPSDRMQQKLERALDISLSASEGGADEDTEWEGGSATGEYTLGDVVKRKD